MSKKKLSLFLRFLILVFTAGIIICIAFRDSWLPGTALMMGRWAFVLFGLFSLYRLSKRLAPPFYRWAVIVCLSLLITESLWNRIQRASLEPGAEDSVTLMTYNLLFSNQRPDASLRLIESKNPDILALQEYTPEWENRFTRSRFFGLYPYREILTSRGAYGIAIYSKFPITHIHYLRNDDNLPFAQVATLDIKGKDIRFFNVHLASPATAFENPDLFFNLLGNNYLFRGSQQAEILRTSRESESTYSAQILIGDLNTPRFEPHYRKLRTEWVDLYQQVGEGWGLNFPNVHNVQPLITLDYFMARGIVEPIEIEVVEGGSSDHLALYGTIKF